MNIECPAEIHGKLKSMLERSKHSLANALGIEFQSARPEELVATMPVDERTKQPFGLLHGGASVALAETLASVGGWLNVDDSSQRVVGVEINANHIRSVTEGRVVGRAVPIHLGARTQVWEIRITRESDEALVSISRCTLAVVSIEPSV